MDNLKNRPDMDSPSQSQKTPFDVAESAGAASTDRFLQFDFDNSDDEMNHRLTASNWTKDAEKGATSIRSSSSSEEEELPVTNADRLLSFFPNYDTTELLDLFQKCNGEINHTIDLLLDAGYEMTGSEPWAKKKEDEFVKPDKYLEVLPFYGSEIEIDEGTYVPQGACPKPGQKYVIGKKDLYTVVDGEDWLDFKLPTNFVEKVSGMYGEPYGRTLPLLPEKLREIRVSPDMAFDLFQLLSLNVMRNEKKKAESKKEVDETTAAPEEAASSSSSRSKCGEIKHDNE